MFDNIVLLGFYVMVILGIGFVAACIENFLHYVKKNRRINRELRDQRQWENFSRRNDGIR